MTQNTKDSIQIKINDKEVSLNPFVTEVSKNVIMGLVNSLTLVEKPTKIEIEIKIDEST